MARGKASMNFEIFGGLVWSFLERFSSQLVTTIVSVILARLLMPEDYGLIAIAMVFVAICDICATSGISNALVQKKRIDEKDYGTAFTLSIIIAVVTYAIMFVAAPLISKFYEKPELMNVLRVIALRIPLTSLNVIQQARVQREMRFKSYFWVTLCGTVVSGGIGIAMAYSKYGVWALVGQYLAGGIINTLVWLIVEKWIPRPLFSSKKACELYSFGWKVLASSLISTLQTDIRGLVVGKVFGTTDLAYFDQGKRYPQMLVNNVISALNKVMLPAYSRVQENRTEVKRLLRKTITIGVFILTPVLLGFAAISDSFVKAILTEKWMDSSIYIKIFCVMYLFRPLESSCHAALLSLGKSGTVLKIMITINVIGLSGMLIAAFIFHSMLLVAISTLIHTFVSVLCFMISISREIDYKWKEQLSDVLPAISIGVVMYIVVSFVQHLKIAMFPLLCLQIIVGGIVYVALSVIIRLEAFKYVITIVGIKRLRR